MGHWSIYEDDDGTNPLDEVWGDEESDRVIDYFEYLVAYEPERLKDTEGLIEDIGAIIWDVLYELEEGRKATRDEILYGLGFHLETGRGVAKEDIEKALNDLYESTIARPVDAGIPDETSVEGEIDDYTDSLTEYLEYLQETDNVRLGDRDRLLKDFRALTWEIFQDLRNRQAHPEELEYLLDLCLEPFH